MKRMLSVVAMLLCLLAVGALGSLPIYAAVTQSKIIAYDHRMQKSYEGVPSFFDAAALSLSQKSFTVDSSLPLSDALRALHASVRYTAVTEGMFTVYAYSPYLFGYTVLHGKRVNIQLCVANGRTLIGQFLISGSY